MTKNALILFVVLVFTETTWSLVEFPKDCLGDKDSICHFGTVKKHSKYETETMTILLGKQTLLKKDTGHIEWISGSMLFEVASKSEIKFKNILVSLQKGKYLIFGDEGQMNVEVLAGNFQIENFQITEGFQAAFSIESQKLKLAPLQALDLKEHLVRYAHLKKLNKNEMKEYLEEFKPKHQNYLLWVAELNGKLIQRSVDHDKYIDNQKRQSLERSKLALQRQRQMYFEKVFER